METGDFAGRENRLPRIAAGITFAILESQDQGIKAFGELRNVVRATLGLLAVQVDSLVRVSLHKTLVTVNVFDSVSRRTCMLYSSWSPLHHTVYMYSYVSETIRSVLYVFWLK